MNIGGNVDDDKNVNFHLFFILSLSLTLIYQQLVVITYFFDRDTSKMKIKSSEDGQWWLWSSQWNKVVSL
jgi:hypothetical protein